MKRHHVSARCPKDLLSWLSSLLLVLMLGGCGEKPKGIELADPAERKSAKRQERPQPRPRSKSVAAPPSTPAPTPAPTPVTIHATSMTLTGAGGPDHLGGMAINSNGALQLDNFPIDFTVRQVNLEIMGVPARDVWPEIDLNAFNRTTQKNYFPLGRTFATTSTYYLYRLPQEPKRLMEPGSYMFTFRFYNNQDFPETGEDRSVHLRKIEFLPEVDEDLELPR